MKTKEGWQPELAAWFKMSFVKQEDIWEPLNRYIDIVEKLVR